MCSAINLAKAIDTATGLIPDLSNIVAEYACSVVTGRLGDKWGSRGVDEGECQGPSGIAVGSTGIFGEEEVYIADRFNHRVQVFSKDGKYVRQWGEKQLGEWREDGAFASISGIALDVKKRKIYV